MGGRAWAAIGIEFLSLVPEEWAHLQHTVTQLELHPTRRSRLTTRPKRRNSNRPRVLSRQTLLAVCVPCAGWHLVSAPVPRFDQDPPTSDVPQKMGRSFRVQFRLWSAWFIWSIWFVLLIEPEKPDKPNRPEQPVVSHASRSMHGDFPKGGSYTSNGRYCVGRREAISMKNYVGWLWGIVGIGLARHTRCRNGWSVG